MRESEKGDPEVGRPRPGRASSGKILLVEDDARLGPQIREYLQREGYETSLVRDGEDALRVAPGDFDLLILDLMLPGAHGLDVLKRLRSQSDLPVLILSARNETTDKVRALGLGADDYVTKPFNPGELRARVRAQLRRNRMGESAEGRNAVTVGELVIDAAKRTVKRGGKDVHLTPTEWELLRAFLRDPGKTLTHQQLFRAVWAASSGDPQQYLRVYVANLRRKLESDPVRPVLIITEPGVGYRFESGA
jgi:two-component system KDP operon response regulator KdpE